MKAKNVKDICKEVVGGGRRPDIQKTRQVSAELCLAQREQRTSKSKKRKAKNPKTTIDSKLQSLCRQVHEIVIASYHGYASPKWSYN